MTRAEQLTDVVTYHGEGAVWADAWGGLRWVDMLAGDVLSLDARTAEVRRLSTGSTVAAVVRPRVGGGCVIVTEREFTLWDEHDLRERATPPLLTGAGLRFNEGGCDPSGAMLCGSMARDAADGAGEMFRLAPDGTTERLFGGVTISNGLGFTAAGDRMYYVDTPTDRVDVFDVDGPSLRDRRPFVRIEDGVGHPDGLWVDAEDGVWIALYGGSAVRHYSADGALEDVIEVGASQVTSCTLGGAGLDTLFITTSREDLGPDDEPSAGAVFTAPAGVRGRPVLPFAG